MTVLTSSFISLKAILLTCWALLVASIIVLLVKKLSTCEKAILEIGTESKKSDLIELVHESCALKSCMKSVHESCELSTRDRCEMKLSSSHKSQCVTG